MSLKTLPRVPPIRYTPDQRNLQTTLDTLVNNINRLAADAQTIDKRITDTARSVVTEVSGEKIYPIPPGPTNLQATGLFQTVVLSWSAGAVEGFAYTEIWRSATDNRGTATLRGTSRSMVFSDSAQEGQTYYYWIRHVNLNSVAGPWNAAAGVSATTNISAATVLAAIEGGLTEIHLGSILAGRIDLIDTPTTGILARLGVTEDDLYDPSTGIFALHQSLSDVVTDPVTGLPTRASQSDLTTLSGAVTDPITGLEARALQLHFESVASEIGVDPVTGAFTANGNAETWSQTATAVDDPTTGLSARAKQEDYTTLASAIGVDPVTGAFTAFGSAESWEATATAVSDPNTGLAAKAGNTEFTNLQTWIGVDDSGTPTVGGKAQKLDQLYLELDSPAGGGSSFAMITQIADIQGTVDDLTAEWGVQIQSDTASGNVISGISLLAGPDGGSFQILADNFALWDPGPNYATNNADKELVIGYFGGQLGIDGAYMRTATIDDAAIISLAVEKLVAGTLTAGTWIKGGDYYGAQLRLGVGTIVRPDETGVNAGYSSVIDANGDAYFENAYVRGDVEATTINAAATITVGQVSDAGALAAADSVDYTGVTGTKPPSDADNTKAVVDSILTLTQGGIRAGKTGANDTGSGFFLGFDGPTPELNVGNLTSKLHWNGSSLVIRGDVLATSLAADTVTTGNIISNAVVRHESVSVGTSVITYLGVGIYYSPTISVPVADFTSQATPIYLLIADGGGRNSLGNGDSGTITVKVEYKFNAESWSLLRSYSSSESNSSGTARDAVVYMSDSYGVDLTGKTGTLYIRVSWEAAGDNTHSYGFVKLTGMGAKR